MTQRRLAALAAASLGPRATAMKCDQTASRTSAIVASLLLLVFVDGCFRATPPPAPPPATTPNYEAYVALRWDAAANAVVRTFNAIAVADDGELERGLGAARSEHAKRAATTLTVTIDAEPRVPWNDVVAVVNACKRAGLEEIEFAFGK